jgi:hypothetical protein
MAESETKGLEEYSHIRILSPGECRFYLTPGGFLGLGIEGKEYNKVSLHRAFPFTFGDDYLSVKDKDGTEIGLIEHLQNWPKQTVMLLKQELERRYFVPIIERITQVTEEFGYSYWEVVTDRGPHRFTVTGLQDNITLVPPVKVLIIDVDGTRYEIPNYQALDSKSRKIIERMI